jgi:hypothetical protein
MKIKEASGGADMASIAILGGMISWETMATLICCAIHMHDDMSLLVCRITFDCTSQAFDIDELKRDYTTVHLRCIFAYTASKRTLFQRLDQNLD